MFWLADREDAAKWDCTVTWHRQTDAKAQGESGAEHAVVEAAVWYQRRGVHFLHWQEPADAVASITLRIEPNCVTWMRRGAVDWTHTFRAGDIAASRMAVGHGALAVETCTQRLAVDIYPVGGAIELAYRMRMAGQGEQPERIELTIRWERHS